LKPTSKKPNTVPAEGGRDTTNESEEYSLPNPSKTIKQGATINPRNAGSDLNSTLKGNGPGGNFGTKFSSFGNTNLT
jgi:hypothetical protein